MLDNADLAYPIELSVCGREFFVSRSMDLVRRIERAFGACNPLSERLGRHAVPISEMAVLLDLFLADFSGVEGRPTRPEIEAWLFGHGVARISGLLAYEVMLLVAGNEVLQRVLDSKKAATPREGVVAPFVPAAASSGRTG